MGTQLASAYVQIIPSAKGMKGMITEELGGEASSAGTSAGESFGSNLVSKIKTIVVAAGIGTAIKNAISEGADLEQSIGGIETLFKDSADKVKEYADNAYKTAGMSANEYMETVTGFSASLLQGLSGDTDAAAEIANMALTDMSDNANKMGTDMESIKNAYQGFAKQNYTMLDNLKLGYGGTKDEMERLLADAQEISGVEYNIDNLADVYNAIHVIQGELDITGTTAEEAASTLSGSLSSMKAAFTNLLGNLALGEDIGPSLKALLETVSVFVENNLLPMLGNIFEALPELLDGLAPIVLEAFDFATNNADEIIQAGVDIVTNLVTGSIESAPAMVDAAIALASSLIESLINTDWTEMASNIISAIRDNLSTYGNSILGTDNSVIQSVMSGITANLPSILSSGVEIISNLANGILESLPTVILSVGEILVQIVGFFLENLPTIIDTGMELIANFAQGILDNLPEVLGAIGQILAELIATVISSLPDILESAITLIGEFASGIIEAVPTVITSIGELIVQMYEKFTGYDWSSIGKNIIDGVVSGIKNAASKVVDAIGDVVSSAIESAKKALGIASPSKVARDQIGQWIPKGVAVGIEANLDDVSSAMDELRDQVSDKMQSDVMAQLSSGEIQIENSVNSGEYQSQSNNIRQLQDILTNINNMLGEYMPQLTNMQLVTDTGVLAGELASAMDYELGTLAAKRNRGT